jgi:plasmid replication initiation protein
MVTETPNPDEQLLPIRHTDAGLFVCDVVDAVFKDIMPHLEHPFFTLSKTTDTKVRRYEHNGEYIEVTPSVLGLATIYDKDILLYCISQLMHRVRNKLPIGPRVRIPAYDLLVFTNRGTAGKDYDAFCAALKRLAGTRISTNVRTGGKEDLKGFGMIDSFHVHRKHGLEGRIQWVEITLSEWVFKAIRADEVLTLHRDYFRLGKPLERRIYELARKHCGRQAEFTISVGTLHKKSGSQSPVKHFRGMVKHIAIHDHLPDYRLVFNEATDNVTFYNRERWWDETPMPSSEESLPPLPTEAYEQARAAAPGYDIHALESEWREWWVSSGRPKLENAPAAFVGFCRSRNKRAPIQRAKETAWEA